MTEAKQEPRQGDKAADEKHKAGAQQQEAPADDPAASLRGRVDQVGALFSKGLDLAEAGLGLGVTLVNRVGVAAQQQILERFMNQAAAAADPGMSAPQQPAPPPAPEMAPATEAAPAPEPESFGISNRLPLMPGGEVKVSFSINNDSMEAPKKVVLSLEGFVGDAHGRRLNVAGFAVKPVKKTIAPMDFEKFVLEGVLPPKAPPDVYRGWVIVSSDSELRIPVWLVVSSL
jgi:hypothetical protein